MEQAEIKDIALNIMDQAHVGPMATIKEDKPHSRYMTFMNDDLTLYTATSQETDKTEDIENNPYTHILLGYDGEGFNDDYVEYKGEISFHDDQALKEKMWTDYMENWFEGPDDPNYVILKITPMEIRVMNKKNLPPKTLNL